VKRCWIPAAHQSVPARCPHPQCVGFQVLACEPTAIVFWCQAEEQIIAVHDIIDEQRWWQLF
jgi:hypothetical protein